MPGPTFDPANGYWGSEVGNPNRPTVFLITGHATSGYDSTQLGRAIGYARGVLRRLYGFTNVTVPAVPGPYSYTLAVAGRIRDIKQWFHDNADSSIVVNDVLDAKGYELLDVKVYFS